jgi:hypothetical protein
MVEGEAPCRLTREERARFIDLAVFAEDAGIPLAVAARLRVRIGGWSPFVARRLCRRLFDLGLLAAYRHDSDRLVLHDEIRSFLRRLTGNLRSSVERALVEAHPDLRPRLGASQVRRPEAAAGPARAATCRRRAGGARRPTATSMRPGRGRRGRVTSSSRSHGVAVGVERGGSAGCMERAVVCQFLVPPQGADPRLVKGR